MLPRPAPGAAVRAECLLASIPVLPGESLSARFRFTLKLPAPLLVSTLSCCHTVRARQPASLPGRKAAVSPLPDAAASVYRQVMHGYTQDKDAYLKRLRRIEGQVRGLQRMVEEDVYCIDVLTQISAATRALQAVALGLLEDHLGHCVAQAVEQGGPEAQAKVKEAADAVSRLVRS
jgi:DNA-binding FrmR family transcriptional regulator